MTGIEIGIGIAISTTVSLASQLINNIYARKHLETVLQPTVDKLNATDNDIGVMKNSLRVVGNDITLALRQQNEIKRGYATLEATVKASKR